MGENEEGTLAQRKSEPRITRMNVAAWLQSLGLERYEPLFRDNEIDWEVLPKLTSEACGFICPPLFPHCGLSAVLEEVALEDWKPGSNVL
jgi:hypothetical protein